MTTNHSTLLRCFLFMCSLDHFMDDMDKDEIDLDDDDNTNVEDIARFVNIIQDLFL